MLLYLFFLTILCLNDLQRNGIFFKCKNKTTVFFSFFLSREHILAFFCRMFVWNRAKTYD